MFDIRDSEGLVEQVKRDHNEGFMALKPGNNNAQIRAFMADVDIQEDGAGGFWFGFGYEKTLYRLDAGGAQIGRQNFELVTEKPSDSERAYLENKVVAIGEGRHVALKNLPGLTIHYDTDRAYFTQFVIKGDHIAFVLTAAGGTDGNGDGDSYGSYQLLRQPPENRQVVDAWKLPTARG